MRYLCEGHIVESNGYISADSIVPIVSADPSIAIQGLVRRVENVQDIALEAIWREDKDLLFQAFMLDPLMSLDAGRAEELFERMYVDCALRY